MSESHEPRTHRGHQTWRVHPHQPARPTGGRRFLYAYRLRIAPDERLVVVVSAQEGSTDARAARELSSSPRAPLWCARSRADPLVALLVLRWTLRFPLHVTRPWPHDPFTRRLAVPSRFRTTSRRAGQLCSVLPGCSWPSSDSSADLRHRFLGPRRLGLDGRSCSPKALRACRCELIKDVPGYFTADPHRDPSARHIPQLSFAQALELAATGAIWCSARRLRPRRGSGLPLVDSQRQCQSARQPNFELTRSCPHDRNRKSAEAR